MYIKRMCTLHYQRVKNHGSPWTRKTTRLSLADPDGLEQHIRNHVKIVPDTGCWEWQRLLVNGYGTLMIQYRRYGVHRIMAWIHHGLNLDDCKMYACHHCDNPTCCNPSHLFVGTNRENMQDMLRKGRRIGSKAAHSKLTEGDIPLIRKLRKKGHSLSEIARRFGVVPGNIGFIISGKTWKHVPDSQQAA